jgi:hypothetical protein
LAEARDDEVEEVMQVFMDNDPKLHESGDLFALYCVENICFHLSAIKREFCDKAFRLVEARDDSGGTVLHAVAKHLGYHFTQAINSTLRVRLGEPCNLHLLKDYASLLDVQDVFGRTPAMYPLMAVYNYMVQYGGSGFEILGSNHRAGIERFLGSFFEAGASLFVPDRRRRCLLHHVAGLGWSHILDFFLTSFHGIQDLSTLRDQHGATPLHYAAFANCKASVNLLIQAGCDPSIADNKGRKAVDVALFFGYTEIADVLGPRQAAAEFLVSPLACKTDRNWFFDNVDFSDFVSGVVDEESFDVECDALLRSPSVGRLVHKILK